MSKPEEITPNRNKRYIRRGGMGRIRPRVEDSARLRPTPAARLRRAPGSLTAGAAISRPGLER
jgi:hypothetical protein